jgi:hypothetical protein
MTEAADNFEVTCPACNGLPLAFDSVPAMSVPEDPECVVCNDPSWNTASAHERHAFVRGYRTIVDGQQPGANPFDPDTDPKLCAAWIAGVNAAARNAG